MRANVKWGATTLLCDLSQLADMEMPGLQTMKPDRLIRRRHGHFQTISEAIRRWNTG